ncbi:hypothetical protein L218DRAFT_1082003, partial [Marasmius fiardii PR-910]
MPKCQPHYPNPEDTRNYGKAPAPQIEVSMAHVLTCWKPIRRPSGVQRRRRQRRPLCLRHFLFRKVTVAVTLVLSQRGPPPLKRCQCIRLPSQSNSETAVVLHSLLLCEGRSPSVHWDLVASLKGFSDTPIASFDDGRTSVATMAYHCPCFGGGFKRSNGWGYLVDHLEESKDPNQRNRPKKDSLSARKTKVCRVANKQDWG